MNDRLLEEFKLKIGRGVFNIIANTSAPKTEEGDLYYTRMLEVIDYLKRSGLEIK